MDSLHPILQSKFCSILPTLPCVPNFLHILWLFFDTPVSDKHCKSWNPTKCTLSAQLLCLQFKHFSDHSALNHNQLINGKKHSQVSKTLFHVIHSIPILTIRIFAKKNGLIKKVSNRSQTTFHIIYQVQYDSAPKFHHQRVY